MREGKKEGSQMLTSGAGLFLLGAVLAPGAEPERLSNFSKANTNAGRSSNAGNNGRKEEVPIKAGSSSRNGLSNLSRAQDQKSSAFDNCIQYLYTQSRCLPQTQNLFAQAIRSVVPVCYTSNQKPIHNIEDVWI
jgi:hypothetical protein